MTDDQNPLELDIAHQLAEYGQAVETASASEESRVVLSVASGNAAGAHRQRRIWLIPAAACLVAVLVGGYLALDLTGGDLQVETGDDVSVPASSMPESPSRFVEVASASSEDHQLETGRLKECAGSTRYTTLPEWQFAEVPNGFEIQSAYLDVSGLNAQLGAELEPSVRFILAEIAADGVVQSVLWIDRTETNYREPRSGYIKGEVLAGEVRGLRAEVAGWTHVENSWPTIYADWTEAGYNWSATYSDGSSGIAESVDKDLVSKLLAGLEQLDLSLGAVTDPSGVYQLTTTYPSGELRLRDTYINLVRTGAAALDGEFFEPDVRIKVLRHVDSFDADEIGLAVSPGDVVERVGDIVLVSADGEFVASNGLGVVVVLMPAYGRPPLTRDEALALVSGLHKVPDGAEVPATYPLLLEPRGQLTEQGIESQYCRE